MFGNEKLSSFLSLRSDHFRVCARCGAFSFDSLSLFCRTCQLHLNAWRLQDTFVPSDNKFPVHSLFSWTPRSDSLLRPLIYSLKGGRSPSEFTRLAKDFSWRMNLSDEPFVICVPPRKNPHATDHALRWANALAKIWQVEICDCLAYPEGSVFESQKKKGIEGRSEREFCLVKNANLPRNSRVVFADDVLTTGSTARAAFKALGEPNWFEVWTIAWRPKLAAEQPF